MGWGSGEQAAAWRLPIIIIIIGRLMNALVHMDWMGRGD